MKRMWRGVGGMYRVEGERGEKIRLIYCFICRRRSPTQDRQGLKSIGGKRIRLIYCFVCRRRAATEDHPDASPLPLHLFPCMLTYDVVHWRQSTMMTDGELRKVVKVDDQCHDVCVGFLSPSVLNHAFERERDTRMWKPLCDVC